MERKGKFRVNIDQWESSLAEYFTEKDKDFLALVAAHPYERPYPAHLAKPGDSKPSGEDEEEEEETPINSLPQFESWFRDEEEQIVDEEEQELRETTANLEQYLKVVQEVVAEIDVYESEINQLREKYQHTSSQTNALHKACENLLSEQSDLTRRADEISHKLNYFNEYDKIMQKLNSPLFSAKNESFTNLLQRIDECVEYLATHPQYKESANYMNLFKRAHSKAIVMIKTLFQSTLSETASFKHSITRSPPSAETEAGSPMKQLLTNNSFSLLYGKFRAISATMKILIEQLEERAENSAECAQVLDDCEALYFSARNNLVGASVMAGVNDLLAQHPHDHCTLFRNGSFMILQVCLDEADLYRHFFSPRQTSERMNTFLMTLCNYLYDALRPLIVHIIHLETLSELCSILKTEILADRVAATGSAVPAVFERTCRSMLEDVQERLVYRTQMYIRSDILGYRPVSGDLAYPEKLQMMREIAESLKKSENEGERERKSSTDLSPADMHGMWYPTLRRTLVCLSKLYRCLDKDIFRGLAQETLSCCIQSLLAASGQISKNKTPADGQLFFIKHLLILREQIQPFHSDFSVTETVLDFSNTRSAGVKLFGHRDRLFSLSSSNAILEFLVDASPQVTEAMVDSKKEVDLHLKTHCEAFVDGCTKSLCDPLMQFLDKVRVIIEVKKEGQSKVNLRQQPFAAPAKLQDTAGNTNKMIKSKLPKLKSDMALYLANRDTEAILFKPVRNKVLRLFAEAEGILNEYYSEEDRQIVGLPSSDELKLILA